MRRRVGAWALAIALVYASQAPFAQAAPDRAPKPSLETSAEAEAKPLATPAMTAMDAPVGAVLLVGTGKDEPHRANELRGIDLDLLRGLLLVSAGRPYDPALVRASLGNLYQTGKFEAIQVTRGPVRPDGRADVIFHLRRARLITGWSFRGNSAIPNATLERAMDLTWGQPLDATRYEGWTRALSERYNREGFPAPSFAFTPHELSPQRAELAIAINEGMPLKIRAVRITTAGKLKPEVVRAALGLKGGDRLSREAIFTGLERLEATLIKQGWVNGRTSWRFGLPGGKTESDHTAVVEAKPAYVDLLLTVEEGQQALVELDAATLLPINDLKNALTVYAHRSLSNYELDTTAENLRSLYVANGYPEAVVTHALRKDPEGRLRVRFTVAHGPQVMVAAINFVGNQGLDANTLRAALSTKGAGAFFAGSPFDQAAWEDDMANLIGLYESHGYAKAKVMKVEKTALTPESLRLTVHVDEGPQTTISRILFGGLTELQKLDALQALPIDPGTPYDPRRVPEWVAAVRAYLAKTGYPLARAIATLEPGTTPADSALRINVVLGPPKQVGRIVVRGNVQTADGVIRRQIGIHAGDVYDAEQLFRTQQAIYQLGFFDRVSVEPIHPITAESEDMVDLVVTVHERETGWVAVGGGYGNPQGPQLSAEFVQNNVAGTGKPIRLEGLTSDQRATFLASLRDPYLLDGALIGELGLNYLRERRQVTEPLYETYGPTVGVSRQLGAGWLGSLRYNWGRTTYLEATAEQVANAGGLADRTNSIFTFGLTRDTRSDLLNPRWGTKVDLNMDIGTPLFRGKLSYVRPRFNAAYYWPLPRRVVLAFGLDAGWFVPLGAEQLVPTDLLFVAGGASSLRGYGSNLVYPIGKPEGGRLTAVGHVEARVPVYGDFVAVAFSDWGDVWATQADVLAGWPKLTGGVGVRYMTPVGPLRIDYGLPVFPTPTFPGLEGLYVGLGHAF